MDTFLRGHVLAERCFLQEGASNERARVACLETEFKDYAQQDVS